MSAGTAIGTDVLHIKDLSVHFQTPKRVIKAVNRVTFELRAGSALG